AGFRAQGALLHVPRCCRSPPCGRPARMLHATHRAFAHGVRSDYHAPKSAGARAMWNYLLPILLLVGSNVFMTFAWYGHLKFTDRPLWIVIFASWGIAFFEYCLMLPANRYGFAVYEPA